MRLTRIASAAFVCAAIAVAGCGGGAENDYAQAYAGVTERIEEQIGTLELAPTGDLARLRAQLRSVAVALGKAGDALAAIQPPDDAAAGHAKVQAGVEILAADARRSAAALADGSSSTAALDALTTIASSKGAREIEAGEQALQQAGYEVG